MFLRSRISPPSASFSLLRVELLAGLVVALALIPEAISFSILAGVDPRVGLYASFTMAVTIAIAGGRPAMISAATGAMALVIVSLVKEYGLEYLLAATILAGVIQIVLGVLGIARLMRFVPRPVTVGFVNALAILIFLAQVPQLRKGGLDGALLVVAGVAMIVVIPRLTKAVPGPLVAILVLTVLVVTGHIEVPNVAGEGSLPDSLPIPGLPSVPFSIETLKIIAPYSFALAAVGLLESLMTARIVDGLTDTRSNKDRESSGQGIANVVTGFFGGMAGCAMIGQTMINVKVSGARTRLSTFSAGVFLLVLVVVAGGAVGRIPMAALVAVMIIVAVSTFDWHSVQPATLRRMPKSDTLITVVTVVATVATDNLAIGVGLGVLTAMALFARKVAHVVDIERVVSAAGDSVTYTVLGELFFASNQEFIDAFEYHDDPGAVIIDLTLAHVWDATAVAALDAVTERYRTHYGTPVTIIGLNAGSEAIHDRLSGRLASAH